MDIKNISAFPSVMTNATIYFNGAELTHYSDVKIKPEETSIRIDGICPNYVDRESIKIGASSGVVISSYEYGRESNDEAISGEAKELKDKIKSLQDKIHAIDVEDKVSKQLLELLSNGMTQKMSQKENVPSISLEELSESLDYYKSKSMEIETLLKSHNDEKEKLEEELEKLEEEFDELGDSFGYIIVNVASPDREKEIPCRMSITYCLKGGASWSPFYNINAESIDSPIKILSKASVRQYTSLEWKSVKLSLSSGAPSNGKRAPELKTWFLNEKKPVPQNRTRFPGMGMGAFMCERCAAPAGEPIDACYDVLPAMNSMEDYGRLNINENALLVTYEIDMPYTIPGNGEAQNIDLRNQEAETDYNFFCAPKIDSECYLLAEIKNPEKLDLPAGTAKLTYDGTYIGETKIEEGMAKLLLTLGSDKRIAVKREKLKDISSKATIFGSTVTKTFLYQITVKNNKKQAAKIKIQDQYPLPMKQEIEVELLKETTPVTDDNKDTGIVTWEDTLASGEEKIYKFGYAIKYPKDMTLDM